MPTPSAPREHEAWRAMIRACYVETDPVYEYIGGLGIGVCGPWRDKFETFLADMGHCPVGKRLKRKNVGTHFSPSNCLWG